MDVSTFHERIKLMIDTIDAKTQIGLISLTVSDLARSLAYYQDHIGLKVQQADAVEAWLGVGDKKLLHLVDQYVLSLGQLQTERKSPTAIIPKL